LQEHASQFGIERGYLLGSVTQVGRFSPQSDLDLAVESLQQGDPFGLAGYLSLHLNREVDVVPLDQCHFADKIRQQGITWSANRSPD
jgi:predicted nucleotidyltransferase